MRRKEERSKQGQTNNKAKQHNTPNVYMCMVTAVHVGYLWVLDKDSCVWSEGEAAGSGHMQLGHLHCTAQLGCSGTYMYLTFFIEMYTYNYIAVV